VNQEGARGRAFKISTPARWIVVATDPAVLKELGDADETVLSMQAAANERNSMEYILGSSIHSDPYHVKVISGTLTSHIGAVLPEIVEEICLTFRENSNIGDEWTPIDNCSNLLSRCISATTNRILVGLPLCRDEEYLDCLMQLSRRMSRTGLFCYLAPRNLRFLIAKLLVHQGHALRTFLSKVGPLIERRRAMLASRSDRWEAKPVCILFSSNTQI